MFLQHHSIALSPKLIYQSRTDVALTILRTMTYNNGVYHTGITATTVREVCLDGISSRERRLVFQYLRLLGGSREEAAGPARRILTDDQSHCESLAYARLPRQVIAKESAVLDQIQ